MLSGEQGGAAPEEITVPLSVTADTDFRPSIAQPKSVTVANLASYSPERQRDLVRLIVASGLLLILGYVVVFATVEAASYPQHWAQTKELLQILLPALTGIIGTVIGFYFGTTAVKGNGPADS